MAHVRYITQDRIITFVPTFNSIKVITKDGCTFASYPYINGANQGGLSLITSVDEYSLIYSYLITKHFLNYKLNSFDNCLTILRSRYELLSYKDRPEFWMVVSALSESYDSISPDIMLKYNIPLVIDFFKGKDVQLAYFHDFKLCLSCALKAKCYLKNKEGPHLVH